jgi:ABC-type transport system involved in cytochrome c biogenesis permease subunit
VLYLLSALRPASDGDSYRLSEFGRLPVVDQGRPKPIDTLARTSLMVLSNRQAMWLDGTSGTSDIEERAGHQKVSAVRWLLDVMGRPDIARHYQVIRIDHPDVLGLMGVETGRKYFSFEDVMAHRETLNEQIERARMMDEQARTPFQRSLLRLWQQLGTYLHLETVVDLHLVPPTAAGQDWLTLDESQHQLQEHGEVLPAAESFLAALTAWHDQRPAEFNAAVTGDQSALAADLAPLMKKIRFEAFVNHAGPFIKSMALYVLVFILAALSWLGLSKPLARTALWVLLLALVVHTLGLVARIYIQGRPPVTNLYSSAVFVGWGTALLGLILERLYRNGIGAVTAAGTGFLTLLVAHNLSLDGDTMTMMQAVLDTNFWLATHVVGITLGYSATFLAGFPGTIYILRGVFTRSFRSEDAKNLGRSIYGIICFATLFSFVGTILGGIWADQSWGRFWGWDPKENGALLIVLWNALVLHARWGGMARQRGIAVLAVAGNIVTSWSWFGTNMLGVGLHAYGFIDSAIFWMLIFVASQLALMGLGMIPLRHWRSGLGPTGRVAARSADGQEIPVPGAAS